YLRFVIEPPEGWVADIEIARPRTNTSEELVVSVQYPCNTDPKARAADLTVLDLSDAMRRVAHDAIATYKVLSKPSVILKELKESRDDFLRSMVGHTPAEIEEFLALARRCAAAGDKWPGTTKARS